MSSVMRRRIQSFIVLISIVCPFSARAGYDFTIIDPPGSAFTQAFGINNSGHVVGNTAFNDGTDLRFSYDSKTGTLTEFASVPGAFTGVIGINEPGLVVGIATDELTFNDRGFILDRRGRFTLFSYPGLDNTDARAIDNSGRVTGYAFQNDFSDFTGFIYDPGRNTFVDIRIPNSVFITAQGINGRDEVVGSVNFDAGGACTGCPAGVYGFLRDGNGTITLFRANSMNNKTRARGITDSGLIAGSFVDPAHGSGEQGFVVIPPRNGGFHLLNVTDSDLVNVPGAFETIPEGITNSGQIAGYTTNADGKLQGFIATPTGK